MSELDKQNIFKSIQMYINEKKKVKDNLLKDLTMEMLCLKYCRYLVVFGINAPNIRRIDKYIKYKKVFLKNLNGRTDLLVTIIELLRFLIRTEL